MNLRLGSLLALLAWNVLSNVLSNAPSNAPSNATGCSSGGGATPSDAGDDRVSSPDGEMQQCAVNSEAGIGGAFGPACFPETAKPSGVCGSREPNCAFCSYPLCPVTSALLSPRTVYECACTLGSWSCTVVHDTEAGCVPVLSCLGPDGGVAASCISGQGVSCAMPEGGTGPVCVITPQAAACGDDSCAAGCVCSDPMAPSCACQ